jgi:AcrR family transcriptional regulator
MKAKTEAKRLAILRAASEVFQEVGFERASMSDIRARLGGSKATLYNYFPSKEKLFFEVMHEAKTHELEEIIGALNPETSDLKEELQSFGQRFLSVLYSPEAIAVRHLAIAESRRSESGKLSFERAVVPLEKHLAVFLKTIMKRGLLRTSDARVAAIHLLTLLESELWLRSLLGVLKALKPDTVRAVVRRAVEVFLSGYQCR